MKTRKQDIIDHQWVRFRRVKLLRALGAPRIIVKDEQLRMARNRQGFVTRGDPSPALLKIINESNEGKPEC